MVMTTGMIRPSWSFADVFALKALQNSMMFTPWGPSAVPTGGAGVALPAGICSFTSAVTFFAILNSSSVSLVYPERLDLFYLQDVELDRSRYSKNCYHDPQGVPVQIDFVDLARKIREWSVDNLNPLVLLERHLRARALRTGRLSIIQGVLFGGC